MLPSTSWRYTRPWRNGARVRDSTEGQRQAGAGYSGVVDTAGGQAESQADDLVQGLSLLDHFSKEQAPIFPREYRTALKSVGVIRVAVPALEAIARLYLEGLQKASQGNPPLYAFTEYPNRGGFGRSNFPFEREMASSDPLVPSRYGKLPQAQNMLPH